MLYYSVHDKYNVVKVNPETGGLRISSSSFADFLPLEITASASDMLHPAANQTVVIEKIKESDSPAIAGCINTTDCIMDIEVSNICLSYALNIFVSAYVFLYSLSRNPIKY